MQLKNVSCVIDVMRAKNKTAFTGGNEMSNILSSFHYNYRFFLESNYNLVVSIAFHENAVFIVSLAGFELKILALSVCRLKNYILSLLLNKFLLGYQKPIHFLSTITSNIALVGRTYLWQPQGL